MNDDILFDETTQDISMEDKLWFNHNWLFHVSDQNVKTLHLTPRHYRYTGEDDGPDHICFSHSITSCIASRTLGTQFNKNLYVYGLDLSKWTTQERSAYIRRPKRWKSDFFYTQEMWVLKPVDIPQIMIISPTANDKEFDWNSPKAKTHGIQYAGGYRKDFKEDARFKKMSDADKDKLLNKYHLTRKISFKKFQELKNNNDWNALLKIHNITEKHKWRIVKVTADPSTIGRALYDKLVYMKDHAPWNNPLMKAVKQYKAANESLLLEYEQMEDLFDLSERFVEYGQELLDTYDTINTLYHCLKKETSIESITFIGRLFGMEADAATTGTTGIDPTSDKKPNVAGTNAKTINTAVLNAGSVMSKFKEFMRRAAQWAVDFTSKSMAIAQTLIGRLTASLANLRKEKNVYKVNNICTDIGSIGLDVWLSRFDGNKSREELGKIYQELKDTSESKIIKEPREISSAELGNLYEQQIYILGKTIGGTKNSVDNYIKKQVDIVKNSKNAEEVKMAQAKVTACVNFTNYIVRFHLRNTMKLLTFTAKGIVKDNLSGNASAANSSSANNTKDNTGNLLTS